VNLDFNDLGLDGLTLNAQYFHIGRNFVSVTSARREADVLLTDGILPGGFVSGGQLPTLNLANEFVDFDEPWFETIIGWHGGTALLEYVEGTLNASAEYTLVTYRTNQQGRDVDNQYPDFLYTDGFTDPQAYTADFDYANVFDRGKDPRSVYKQFQDRITHIAVLQGETLLISDLVARLKLKYVHDEDDRKRDNLDDDYQGNLYLLYALLQYQWTDELKTGLGYEFQFWDENRRSGSQETGFSDYLTRKHTGRLLASYNFGGLAFTYLFEYFHKDQDRDRPGTPDQDWRVWRSKATLEVGW
jgi:hypothetical protein